MQSLKSIRLAEVDNFFKQILNKKKTDSTVPAKSLEPQNRKILYSQIIVTLRYTPWDSFSATSCKINLVRSLTNRVLRICSPSVIDEELKTLRTILSKNGYPGYILAKLVVARDPPGRRIGARFCPLVLQVPWLGKRTDELVKKANN